MRPAEPTPRPRRSALYLPASNPRAIAKARGLACDLAILDLEDAVAADAKPAARAAAVAAGAGEWMPDLIGVRINALDSDEIEADLAALAGAARLDLVVVPKVETSDALAVVADRLGRPMLAMIETPAGLYAARAIAAAPGVAGLIAGTNDIAAALRVPTRTGLALALQTIVLAARGAGVAAFDGVYNRLDDGDGFAAECAEGRAFGFDGKALIHPAQIAAANRVFGPTPEEIEEAHALIAAATGGAERFRGRMIEAMHVAEARRLVACRIPPERGGSVPSAGPPRSL